MNWCGYVGEEKLVPAVEGVRSSSSVGKSKTDEGDMLAAEPGIDRP